MRFAPPRIALAALLLVPVLGACGGSDSGGAVSDAAAGHVNVIDNKFDPKSIEVSPGDTVTWDFKGKAQHNVHGKGFDSGNKNSGTFEYKFNSSGTYEYICTIHPGMTGKITVG
jgi:plastocyanin